MDKVLKLKIKRPPVKQKSTKVVYIKTPIQNEATISPPSPTRRFKTTLHSPSALYHKHAKHYATILKENPDLEPMLSNHSNLNPKPFNNIKL